MIAIEHADAHLAVDRGDLVLGVVLAGIIAAIVLIDRWVRNRER